MNIMKTLKYFLSIFILISAVLSCNEDELGSTDFVDSVVAPTNVTVVFDITQDNTGLVTITPNSEGAVSYDIYFGDNTSDPINVKQGKNITHIYAEGNYEVKVIAAGITGLKTEITQPLTVSFKAPENLVVTIENDAAISKQVNVTATADFATTFDVYFGEEGNDDPVAANIGETVSYIYAEPGIYTIKVVAKGGAIETTEYIVENFEVTAILQPIASAATPPIKNEEDVVSIFSDAYTNITVNEWNPGWGQSTVLSSFDVDGDNILKYDYLNYTGIVTDYDNPTDLSTMEYVHFDYWSNDAENIGFKIVNTNQPDGSPEKESEITITDLKVGAWGSVEIPLSDFTTDMSAITQMLFVSNGVTVFIDNLYFYKAPSATGKPLIFDDFEGNGNITTWAGDACGMDNNFVNPFQEGINTSNTVLEYNDTGEAYANVRFDTDSNFDLSINNTFTLKIYVPSSSITGTQPNQISLKLQDGTAGEPWTTQTEIIKTIALDTWQEITFDFANDDYINWSTITTAPVDRTDLNRVVLQVNSEGNNDTVIAYIDDFSYGIDTIDTPPYATDDFEGNGTITTWTGDACGMDNNFVNPHQEGINTSSTVLEYNDTGGTYANVRFDITPNFDLTAKSKFTLKVYVESSSISGSQPNQISLKLQDGTVAEPWVQQTEIIKPIALDVWQEVTFDFANDVIAGAADPISRTDFNRVVLQVNSEGNSDTVIAYIDDFNYHN